jgi:flagellar basal body-associated protein FliL
VKKKLIILVAVLLAGVGGAYKTVLAKPKAKEPEPKVHGSVYVLGKEFLVNLHDGRFAKLTVALVLAHDDTSTVAAGGHGAAPKPPEGYGTMAQEAVIRAVVTDDLTDVKARDVIDREGREHLQDRILKDIRKKSDVKVEHVLFPDVTVQ